MYDLIRRENGSGTMKINSISHILIIILSMFLIYVPAVSIAESDNDQKYKIYTYLLRDRLDAEGTLSYNKLLENVTREVSDSIEFKPAHLRRSARSFINDKSSCVFPSAINGLRRVHKDDLGTAKLIQSAPIDYVSIRLYTRETDPVITDMAQLKGKTVGHLLGSIGETLIGIHDVKVLNVSDEAQLLKMLFANRFDVLMGHHPDIPMAIKRLKLKAVTFDPKVTVYHTSVHIVCHEFEGVDRILSQIDYRIRGLRKSGEAQEILGEFARIVPLTESELNIN